LHHRLRRLNLAIVVRTATATFMALKIEPRPMTSESPPSFLGRYSRLKSYLSKAPLSTRNFYQSPHLATLPPLDGASGDLRRSKSSEFSPSSGESEPIADFDCAPTGAPRHLTRPDLVLAQTPPLPPPDSAQFPAALTAKLSVCDADCFWEDPAADSAAKKTKTAALTEILELARGGALAPSAVAEIAPAIEKPLFRPIADVNPVWMRSDDMVAISVAAWPHFSLNFQILNALIAAFPDDARWATPAYARAIMDRFHTPDVNERLALAALLISVCTAQPAMTDQVLITALNLTAGYLENHKSPNVVAPALTIALQAFTDKTPTAENLTLLPLYFQYILPLLGGLHYLSYHTQMSQIIDLIVKAVPVQSATPTMKAILGRFPLTRSAKAIEFLRLLTFVLTKVSTRDIKAHLRPIFLLFARCLGMGQVKLASAACPMWNRIELEPIIMDNAKVVFSLVYPILTTALKETWSSDISQKVDEILRVLNRIDSAVFQDLCRGKRLSLGDQPQDSLKTWASIARTASKTDKDLRLAEKLFELQRVFSANPTMVSFKSTVTVKVPPKAATTPPQPDPVIRKPGVRSSV
jgi:hypothetical protein